FPVSAPAPIARAARPGKLRRSGATSPEAEAPRARAVCAYSGRRAKPALAGGGRRACRPSASILRGIALRFQDHSHAVAFRSHRQGEPAYAMHKMGKLFGAQAPWGKILWHRTDFPDSKQCGASHAGNTFSHVRVEAA